MTAALISPANASILGFPAILFSIAIPLVGVLVFAWILWRRFLPLRRGAPDSRTNRIRDRLLRLLKFAILQYRQPRYALAGVMHILLFAGFAILSARSVTLVMLGIVDGFTLPGLGGGAGRPYASIKDIAGTVVLLVCIVAIIRRVVFRPKRYAVPPKYGKDHTGEAVSVLLLISGLMLCDMAFEGSLSSAQGPGTSEGGGLLPWTGAWVAAGILGGMPTVHVGRIHLTAYFLHDILFFFFLCFLPMGKHFHVITALPNVFLMKLTKGRIKPVRWDVPESDLLSTDSFGVKRVEDWTWKHILDFYSCADCGRCSDQCPANAVGRPLSPRFLSIKCRDHLFTRYPLLGKPAESEALILGQVLEEDEVWSCTTCGACEEECPLTIEVIDKIVDVRRGMVDDGRVPPSLQKALNGLDKRGNPYGKLERRRGDWTNGLPEEVGVKVFPKTQGAKTLYFVDSTSSYDDRMQEIARATARVLQTLGIDWCVLGSAERDSGHEVRRFGEEMLFGALRDANTRAILNSGVTRIVTADPHAFNALKNDYVGIPPVDHMSAVMAGHLRSGQLRFKRVETPDAVYTYHDSCYLGRHNGIYDAPRRVMDAVPGLRRVEMTKCRDRSFCCGGGGLNLFYEPVEERRMASVRLDMARSAGANVIVTACPFCMVHFEDAIKTGGMEEEMAVVDLVELVDRHMIRA